MMQEAEEEDDDYDIGAAPVIHMDDPSTDSGNDIAQPSPPRLLRWYHQLNAIHSYMKSDVQSPPVSSDVSGMITMVVQHYEQLHTQYHTLLDLLHTEPTDNDAVTKDWKCDVHGKAQQIPVPEQTTPTESLLPTVQLLDPLSVFVLEEDAKAHREQMIRENYHRDRKKSNRNHQTYTPDEPQDPNDPSYIRTNATAYGQLIMKDLLRLPSPHVVTPSVSTLTTDAGTAGSIADSSPFQGRIRQLQSILYIFAISHAHAGYIQGMHEIASYCLYAVEREMDLPTNTTEALAYWYTEQILMLLFLAYDVVVVPTTTGSTTNAVVVPARQPSPPHLPNANNPLLQMSNRILQCFGLVDPSLYTLLQQSSSSIPYQLIFTKWIRLLFGRDITAGMTISTASSNPITNTNTHMFHSTLSHADTVIYLWDVLLDASCRMSLQQQPRHQYSSTATMPSPLQILAEYFCAARLWHHKYTIQHLYQHSTAGNNFLLHWFMNVPPESLEQLQHIVLRMNYIANCQHNNVSFTGSISHSVNTGQTLPPFHPVSAETYAMTQHQSNSQRLTQATTTSRIHPLWDTSTCTNADNTSSDIGGSTSFLHSAAAALADATSSSSLLLDPSAPSLTAFAETITAKTQSIQKLFVKEWEQVRAHLQQQDFVPPHQSVELDGDDRTEASATHSQQSNLYNLDYYNNDT